MKGEQARRGQDATKGQFKIGVAVREVEDALAAASWQRGQAWTRTVHNALQVMRDVLRATRQSADAEDSLLSQIALEEPRLEARARRLRGEYSELERVVESLCTQLETLSEEKNKVEDVRQSVRRMISALRLIEAKEAELLYEAFLVDIGNVD